MEKREKLEKSEKYPRKAGNIREKREIYSYTELSSIFSALKNVKSHLPRYIDFIVKKDTKSMKFLTKRRTEAKISLLKVAMWKINFFWENAPLSFNMCKHYLQIF